MKKCRWTKTSGGRQNCKHLIYKDVLYSHYTYCPDCGGEIDKSPENPMEFWVSKTQFGGLIVSPTKPESISESTHVIEFAQEVQDAMELKELMDKLPKNHSLRHEADGKYSIGAHFEHCAEYFKETYLEALREAFGKGEDDET